MNLLLSMTLSGSIIFLLYLTAKPLANRFLTAHWKYGFLKICVLFYLIPYQYFQNEYLVLCSRLLGTAEVVNPLWKDNIYKASDTIFRTEDGQLHFKYWLPLLIVSTTWLSIIAVFLYRQIRKYHSCSRNLLLLSQEPDAQTINTASHCHSHVMHTKKQTRILRCPFVKSPFTIGLFHPTIILPKQEKDEDLPLYLLHELYHIKNHDTLWKSAAFLVILLHWYNPLVYILFLEMRTLSEICCDEHVIEPLDTEQKVHYADLIIKAAQNKTAAELLFSTTFCTGKKQTRNRILSITKTPHIPAHRKIITAVIIFLAVLSMPISVLAYHPLTVYNMSHYQPDCDMVYIVFDNQQDPFETEDRRINFTQSDTVVIDENGNQYAVTAESRRAARTCSHEYIKGKRYHHMLKGNGCDVSFYIGTYCKKCQSCQEEQWDNQCTNHTGCPHKL